MKGNRVISSIVVLLLIGAIVYFWRGYNKQEDVSTTDYLAEASEYLEDRQYSKALEQYKLAINAEPSNTDAYLAASEIYILKANYNEAIKILQNGESQVVNPDKIHHKMGQLLLLNKDLSQALEYLEMANTENPNNSENVIDLVKLYAYYPDKKDKAIEVLEKMDVDEGEGYVWKSYYLALLSCDEVQVAINLLKQAEEESETSIKGQISSLMKIFESVQSEPDDIIENNTRLAYEMMKVELYYPAISLLQEVIAENDEYYAAYMYLGICHINMDEFETALENLRKANETDSEQLQPLIFLAQVYTMQNNQKEAISTYEQALSIDKSNELVRYDYARSLLKFGLFGQARHEYEELLDIEVAAENSIRYKTELVSVYLDHLDEYEKGLELAREVVEDWKGFSGATAELKAAALDALGWAFEKNTQKDEALRYLKQSRESFGYLPSTYYHLGVIYAEIENYEEAQLNFERAIDLDIEGQVSIEARSRLESLLNKNEDQN